MVISSEQRIVRLNPFDNVVGQQDGGEAQHRLIQTCGCAHALAGAGGHGAVNIQVDDVALFQQHPVVADELVEHAEIPPEDAPAAHQEHNHNGRHKAGKGDGANLRKAVGPVDLRRLVNLLRNARDGAEIDNAAIPCAFPQVDQHQQKRPGIRRGVDVGRRDADAAQDMDDQAVVIVQQILKDGVDHNPRNEKGQEREGLEGFLEPDAAGLVHGDGDKHLHHNAKHDERNVVQEGVARQRPQLAGNEQKPEVGQTNPRAAQDALVIVVLLEGDHQPAHGQIAENEHIQEGGQKQDQIGFVFYQDTKSFLTRTRQLCHQYPHPTFFLS